MYVVYFCILYICAVVYVLWVHVSGMCCMCKVCKQCVCVCVAAFLCVSFLLSVLWKSVSLPGSFGVARSVQGHT